VPDQLQRPNLGRKRILLDLNFVPISGRPWIGKIAHYLDPIGAVFAMKSQGCGRVIFRRVQSEMEPKSERRPVHLTAFQRALDTFPAIQRSASKHGRDGAQEEATSKYHSVPLP